VKRCTLPNLTFDDALLLLSIKQLLYLAVLGIRIRRIRMFLGLQDPYPLVRGMDPDPEGTKKMTEDNVPAGKL
jgi:hypothetical protein